MTGPGKGGRAGTPLLLTGSAITGFTGGLASPAVLLVAAGAFVLARTGRWRVGAAGGAGALVAGAGLALARGASPEGGASAIAAALVAACAGIPAWYGRRTETELQEARDRASGLERLLDTRSNMSPGRNEAIARGPDPREAVEPLRALARAVREAHDADQVVVWRRVNPAERASGQMRAIADGAPVPPVGEGDRLEALVWDGGAAGSAPRFADPSWDGIVRWAVEERRVQVDSAAGPRLIAAPITAGAWRDGALGVLTVVREAGFQEPAETLRRGATLYGMHGAALLMLKAARGSLAQERARTGALVSAVREFQEHRAVEPLAEAICRAAALVAGSQDAMLVRWIPEEERGEVQAATEGAPAAAGEEVARDSAVGDCCTRGLPLVWADARAAAREQGVLSPGDRRTGVGALAVVPLVREDKVLGAVVVSWDRAGGAEGDAVNALRVLASLAGVQLETAWAFDEVEKRARTDQLTGLWNRRHFEDQIAREIETSNRYDRPVGLVVADVDYFKRVNDTFGHDAGDAVLRHVARVFQESVRAVDTCARFGGEEIAVLLPSTPLDGARDFAERVRQLLERRPAVYQGRTIPVTASFGVACYPAGVRTRDELFGAADKALYRAKQDGRNQVKTFDPNVVGTNG